MKPAEFLSKYSAVIFDMDGVITSEQNYWDIAALSVYELLNDSLYFGRGNVGTEAQARKKEIRADLFCGDRFIIAAKERGVNSNWDLAYLAFCHLLCGKAPDEMTRYVESSPLTAFELYDEAAADAAALLDIPAEKAVRGGELWLSVRDRFQEWYLGDELFERMMGAKSSRKGKSGMWQTEDPVVPLDKLTLLLETLTDAGLTLGIATGRNKFELTSPLRSWDCEKYFSPEHTVDYDYVTRGEERLRRAGISARLTKPHPYMFLKAAYGTAYDDVMLCSGAYDASKLGEVLIVGDAGSDILAAKAMGADFLAVLTGIGGERGRRYFEESGAEYILPNVLYMAEGWDGQ